MTISVPVYKYLEEFLVLGKPIHPGMVVPKGDGVFRMETSWSGNHLDSVQGQRANDPRGIRC
jgi:hypothetical protein